jgi:hypothetical protein
VGFKYSDIKAAKKIQTAAKRILKNSQNKKKNIMEYLSK